MVGRRTCDREVAGSIPGRASLHSNPGQVIHTCVPLSPSSVIIGIFGVIAGKVTTGYVISHEYELCFSILFYDLLAA